MVEINVSSRLTWKTSPEGSRLRDRIISNTSWLSKTANVQQARAVRRGWKHPSTVEEVFIHALSEDKGLVLCPRGLWREVKLAAEQEGIQIGFVSNIPIQKSPIQPFPDTLRPYQRAAVEAVGRNRDGLIVLPCGAGKTYTGAAVAKVFGGSTLVLCPTTDTVTQWRESMKVMNVENVQVKTYASAFSFVDESYATVIVDECHHAASTKIRELIESINCRRRIGFTATPTRSDDYGPLLQAIFGPTIHESSPLELSELGYLLLPKVIPVESGWEPDPEAHFRWQVTCRKCGKASEYVGLSGKICPGKKRSPCGEPVTSESIRKRLELDWTKTVGALSSSIERNQLVLALVELLVKRGRKGLLIVIRVELACELAASLSRRGISAAPLHGKLTSKQREESIRRFKTGGLSVIVGTTVADEALDLPDADFVVVAAPGKAGERAVQRGGRATRPAGDKHHPVVMDIVDAGETLERHWQHRRKAYEKAWGRCVVAKTTLKESPNMIP